jgi:hypothetical protein
MASESDDARDIRSTTSDLWRRQRRFRDSLRHLISLSEDQVKLIGEVTREDFETDQSPTEALADEAWSDLVRALRTLYSLSRVRHSSLGLVTEEMRGAASEELQHDEVELLITRLAQLLSPDRQAEHEAITRRTAEAAGVAPVEEIDVVVDFRVQPAFPDERLQLVPVMLLRMVTWDPSEHEHRAVVVQLTPEMMEGLRDELETASKQRDEVLQLLRKQGLA